MLLKCFVYSQGLGRSGNEYGPLTDNPDWSYAGKHKIMIWIVKKQYMGVEAVVFISWPGEGER